MKILISFLVMLLTVSTFATEIDKNLESIIIDNPTLQGKYFCAFDNLDSMRSSAAFICNAQGYIYSQVTGTDRLASSNTLCLMAYEVGAGFNILTRERDSISLSITKIKCSGFKPPSSVPCIGCDEPTPVKPTPDPYPFKPMTKKLK